MYSNAMDGMHSQLLQHTCSTPPMTYVADLKGDPRGLQLHTRLTAACKACSCMRG